MNTENFLNCNSIKFYTPRIVMTYKVTYLNLGQTSGITPVKELKVLYKVETQELWVFYVCDINAHLKYYSDVSSVEMDIKYE